MYKTLIKLLIFFLTVTLNGQTTVLLKNFNPKAKELKHQLNKSRDSLILSCEQPILKVDIFNEDFEMIVTVEGSNTKIPLHNLPIGEFVVEAKLEDKIILMEIVRYEIDTSSEQASIQQNEKLYESGTMLDENMKPIKSSSNNRIEKRYEIDTSSEQASIQQNEKLYESGTMLDENMKPIKSSSNNRIENMLSPGKVKKSKNTKKFFWVVLIKNDKTGSSQTMKLVDESLVTKLIKRNKLEVNNAKDKINELRVWEVYDTSKFMRAQLADPNYFTSSSSELFNVIPYYVTADTQVAVSLK